jgi:hypothetical protein
MVDFCTFRVFLIDTEFQLSLNKNLMATPSLWTQPDRLIAFGNLQIFGLVVPL